MRGTGIAIQVLAALLLVGGIALTGYALLQPPESDTTYVLTVEKADGNQPGTRSASIAYDDLSDEARLTFGRAKLGGPQEIDEQPPSQLRSNSFVVDGETTYELGVTEHEHVTERLATLFGGTTAAFIGAFVFVSWLDVL